MRPPFEVGQKTLKCISRVERLLGRYEGLHSPRPLPRLRRSDRVRTIRDSLAIEGNTLTLDQATTVLEGKRVVAPPRRTGLPFLTNADVISPVPIFQL